VIRLDAATVLLQWATGGMFFCWLTTRHREVGLGYGWLLRGVFAALAGAALTCGLLFGVTAGRELAAAGLAAVALAGLAVSVVRRKAGVAGQRAEHDRRSRQVAVMTGIERVGTAADAAPSSSTAKGTTPREFPPGLDLAAALVGAVGLVAAGLAADGHEALAVLRILAGAAFLGAVTDAMLLGHWYLVQPGLPRRLLLEQVRAMMLVWPVEVIALLLPTGMVSVLNGSIDDGWSGTLGWFWVLSAITTLALGFVTRAALRERAYSAVMAATGLLYLAILTAFGTDLVARAVLAP